MWVVIAGLGAAVALAFCGWCMQRRARSDPNDLTDVFVLTDNSSDSLLGSEIV